MNNARRIEASDAWELMLRTVSGLLRVFEERLEKEIHVPLTWYDVIVNLYEAPEMRLRMQALSDALVLSRSGVTRLVDRIEVAGLVRREPSAEDRRGYYAILTDKGREAVERAKPVHRVDIEREFGQYLSERELEAAHRIMEKIWKGNPNLRGHAES